MMEKTTVRGSESWRVSTPAVDACITENGGMTAPVVFTLPGNKKASPYYVNPWAGDTLDDTAPAVLRHLRGDFFCLPFGGNNRVDDEDHQPHGESSFSVWKFDSCTEGSTETILSLDLAYTKCVLTSAFTTF